jgi:hexosaminidase
MVGPEIEMPGHAQAVLASFPDFACQQGPFDVWNEWGISKKVFCAGSERVYDATKTFCFSRGSLVT